MVPGLSGLAVFRLSLESRSVCLGFVGFGLKLSDLGIAFFEQALAVLQPLFKVVNFGIEIFFQVVSGSRLLCLAVSN